MLGKHSGFVDFNVNVFYMDPVLSGKGEAALIVYSGLIYYIHA